MTEVKHTPTPWDVAIDEDGQAAIIKGCSFVTYAFPTDLGLESGSDIANADHIVKCVNLHDELVEALKALYIQGLQSNVNSPANEWGEEVLSMSLATLKKAGAL